MPFAHRPTEPRRVLEVFAKMRGVNQKFLGDTTHVDTGASQIPLLRHRHVGATGSGHAASTHAAGTRADGKEVVIVSRHVITLLSLDCPPMIEGSTHFLNPLARL